MDAYAEVKTRLTYAGSCSPTLPVSLPRVMLEKHVKYQFSPFPRRTEVDTVWIHYEPTKPIL